MAVESSEHGVLEETLLVERGLSPAPTHLAVLPRVSENAWEVGTSLPVFTSPRVGGISENASEEFVDGPVQIMPHFFEPLGL